MNPNEKLMQDAATTIVALKARVDELEAQLGVRKSTGSTPADALAHLIRKSARPNLLAGDGLGRNLSAVQKSASRRSNS